MNVYNLVTKRILEEMKKGVIPWQQPWIANKNGAFNRISKKPYSFLNQMLLRQKGEYATFKQWKSIGGKIRKGEKAEMIVFWKMIEKENKETGEKEKIPLLRYYNVFHVSQVENVEPLEKLELNENIDPIEEADDVIRKYVERENLQFKEKLSDKAFYSPEKDEVVVPKKEQYRDINEYYSTTFHELVHSTGHEKRLNRQKEKRIVFASESYTKEELVAEIGSAALMNHLGIETGKTFKNSTAYIESWIKVLMEDDHFIVNASRKAEKAVDYILKGECK